MAVLLYVPEERPADLEEHQHEDAAERVAPHAAVVYEAIRREGSDELKRSSSALFWSAIAAGLSMGFSFATEGLLRGSLAESSWRPLIVKLGYAIGFIIVVLGRQQLFTENTLTPILPLLRRKNSETFIQVARLWAVVLIGNVIGTLVFGWVAARTAVFHPETQRALHEIATEMFEASATEHFLRAIFAGWLIALMVWLLPFAETARVFVILLITYIVGLAHFDHIIAGSVAMFHHMFNGSVTLGSAFASWWIPTLLGNIVGGVLLVAVINHAQVTSGGDIDE